MVVKSPTITIVTGAGLELPECPMWMMRIWARSKELGLPNVQKRMEELARKRECSLG